jgi:hypothetical protein
MYCVCFLSCVYCIKKVMFMIFQNKTLILASTLVFLVLSSKNIIIYNEEILVALSFLCFVLFSFSAFKESVTQTFADRRNLIHQELEQMLVLKAQTIQQLHQEYTHSLHLVTSLEGLKNGAIQELESSQDQRIQAFKVGMQKKCVQKVLHLLNLEKQFQHEVHTKIQRSFQQSVLDYFKKHQSSLTPQLIDQACAQLQK